MVLQALNYRTFLRSRVENFDYILRDGAPNGPCCIVETSVLKRDLVVQYATSDEV